MTTAIAFCGPSTNALDLSGWQNVMLAGPAEAGDIAWAAANGYSRIGLIDGYFGSTRAPWHKEIIYAADRGVGVWGSSSMGALRGAELIGHGMTGVGRVFQLYAQGVVTADDEVTLLHGPVDTGYVPLTEALVNVRLNLLDFVAQELLTADDAAALLRAGQSLHYKDRTIEAIGEAFMAAGDGRHADVWATFRMLWETRAIDWKAQDAAQLLDRLVLDEHTGPAASSPPAEGALVHTAQFQSLLNEIGVS